MVPMDRVGTSVVDLDEDGEQLDYLEVAWLLQEKLNDFVEGGKGGPPGLELRSLLNLVATRKIVSVDSKKMRPVICKSLPKELLLLVLSRLPLADITRLRSLSKEWNRDMATVNSEINRALDETSPTMVAVFSRREEFTSSGFIVTICDLSTHRSPYSYHLHPGDHINGQWNDMGARDGGLVCFVSTWEPSKASPLCIVVVNLLTRVRRKLPPLQYNYLVPPKMVHIEVDSETKCYRVVVVGKNVNHHPRVEIYHSGARQWTKVTPPLGSIFGVTDSNSKWTYYNYDRSFRFTSLTRSVYDFAEGQLKRCDERGPSRGTKAFQKDCVFVLQRNTSDSEILATESFCITKYRMQNNGKDSVQERSYLCSPLEALLEKEYSSMTLKACEGFLMVYPSYSDNREKFWLLNLSSGEWSSLPNCFEEHKFGTYMSRASWNVVT